jgi:hypothetical protein
MAKKKSKVPPEIQRPEKVVSVSTQDAINAYASAVQMKKLVTELELSSAVELPKGLVAGVEKVAADARKLMNFKLQKPPVEVKKSKKKKG